MLTNAHQCSPVLNAPQYAVLISALHSPVAGTHQCSVLISAGHSPVLSTHHCSALTSPEYSAVLSTHIHQHCGPAHLSALSTHQYSAVLMELLIGAHQCPVLSSAHYSSVLSNRQYSSALITQKRHEHEGNGTITSTHYSSFPQHPSGTHQYSALISAQCSSARGLAL